MPSITRVIMHQVHGTVIVVFLDALPEQSATLGQLVIEGALAPLETGKPLKISVKTEQNRNKNCSKP